MTYYKIVRDGHAVDAGFTFLRWDERHGCLMGCDPQDAHFIQSGDGQTVYRAGWLNPVPASAAIQYETVEAAIVTRQEYDDLKAQLDDGETPAEPQPMTPEPEPEPEPTPDPEQPEPEKPMTVQQMREKIAELEQTNSMLMECLLEMSEVVYA